ncbi:MAG: hypothetical protein ACHQ9S_01220 [Candidatus Binatia bacterium]
MSEHGSSWVPKGKSFWELSCHGKPTTKANRDYEKRTRQTPKKIRTGTTFVVVSARRWGGKAQWLKAKRRAGKWADVRAYNADDIEQWLEQNPAVALQFAEEIGLTGQGVESVAKHWKDWSQQSDPSISIEALLIDHQSTRDRFLADLQRRLEAGQSEPYTIRADSVGEAAAFVCAGLLAQAQLNVASLVVTEPDGWRFVGQNPTLKVVVAARPEIAEKPTRRNGLCVIIPYAAGDMAGYYRGAAGRDSNADLILERPRTHEFEKALSSIGLDEADANRLAVSTGRSWSVFRRRRAVNPSIRKPAWLGAPQAGALSTLCLLGAWSTNQAADREIVSQLSGRTYEEVERDLLYLARVDDAPVLEIGEVWKAKSSLELLDLFGDRITRGEIDRFFEVARNILLAPDPELELPDEKRYAAQIYGKVRPQSALLIQALCDTLIKLAVRGLQVPVLLASNIEGRIAAFVRELLHEADGTRWLSLSSFLPALAESAPDTFLKAVELSLARPDAPVTRLLTETSGPGFMGRCWHSGLLWALETLAWAPEQLTRVVLVLAALTKVEIKGNWGNLPEATLLNIFRSWLPQTAADVDDRITVLDTLIAKEPDVAFDLLDRLVRVGPDSSTPSARPKWRDDDAGAGHGVPAGEYHGMLIAAADRLIAQSEGHPHRIARAIEKIRVFDAARIKAILALAGQFARSSASDEDRDVIRTALRKHIYWHCNYDKARGKALDKKLADVEKLYGGLSPEDLVVRHRWLFSEGWPNLPARVRDGDRIRSEELRETWRIDALREVYTKRGLPGIEQLAAACANQPYVGVVLAKLEIETANLAEWIVERGGDLTPREPIVMTVRGLLRASEAPRSTELITAVLNRGREQNWDAPKIARLLVLAREEPTTWEIVASCGAEVEGNYWATTDAGFWLRDDGADFALRRLLEAGRPRSALQVCDFDLEKVDAKLLAEGLERMLKGEEPDGVLLDSWHLGEAVDRLEASAEVDRDQLVRLEFGLIPALGYDGEQRAKSLYQAILSEPKLFTELLCILYKPANGEPGEPPSEATKAAAQTAWQVLHHCRRQPGTQPDGTIDRDAFVRFIDEARELCRQADRLRACDSTLGQILAHAPADSDGVWPFEPARDVLDRPELEDMRHGFQIGVSNKRGATMRAYDEGGGQERNLADTYRSHARALQSSHVNVATALEELARSYEKDGLRQDQEANLRREGY